jgi:2-methylcitrate dehydratase
MDYGFAGTATHGCPVACMDGCKPAASVPLRRERGTPQRMGSGRCLHAGCTICASCEARTAGGLDRADTASMGVIRHHVAWWRTFRIPLPYRTWAIENVLFKVMPVKGHGMSAVETALAQRRSLLARDPTMDAQDHIGTIAKIEILTCAAAKLSIDKIGALRNTADRVHCMQYIVAVALLKGASPEHVDYADSSPYASSSAVDQLRAKTEIYADALTRDFMDLAKRSLASELTIYLTGGQILPEVLVEFPSGHPQNSQTPLLVSRKFRKSMGLMFSEQEITEIEGMVDQAGERSISSFVDLLVRSCSSRL